MNQPLHNLTAGVPTDLYIGGKWKRASDDKRFDVIDPATESVIASVASASVEDARAAVDAAEAAFGEWAARKPRERGEILRKAFEVLTREGERFARLITLENGKSLADARGELAYSAEFFRWYAEEAVRNVGEVSRAPSSGARILVQHKPAGIALLVTPWNFPLAMATRKIGPAIAAGCPVVVKPASETPLTMLALMPILEEAGVPPGIVNVIPSRRSGPVVDTILKDMRVRVVSFTGSTEVGRTLLRAAAENVVKPVMELGGNAPFLVFEDADLDAAVEGAMIAKMRNMGEACTAANRFLVHEKVHDAFAAKLTERMNALKMGNGLEEGVALGPLVNASTRDKVVSLVADAVGKGAKVLAGGKAPGGQGYLLSGHGSDQRTRWRGAAARGDFRAGGCDPDLPRGGGRDPPCQRHGIRAGRLSLHARSRARHARLRAARLRHDRPQPRHRLRSRRAVRRHEAERHRPRGRPRRHHGISRNTIRVRELVTVTGQSARGEESMEIGWIGIGRMGFPMVVRLLKAGHKLKVWNRTRSKAEPLVPMGATLVDRMEDLCGADVVFTMLATGHDLEEVCFGAKGLAAEGAAKKPAIIVDCSTIGLDESTAIREKLAARGIQYLAAPVSGNPRASSPACCRPWCRGRRPPSTRSST